MAEQGVDGKIAISRVKTGAGCLLVAAVLGAVGCASSEKSLGYELVAVSAAGGVIRAVEAFQLREGTWAWQVTLGDDVGQSIERSREPTDEYDAAWVETEDNGRREYWAHDDDGNLVLTAVVEPADRAITFFKPPMIIVYAELAPDGPREQKVNMRVMDLARPKRMKHHGVATRTVQYMDDQLIRTPLGTMPAKRIEITFRADLGLARAENATTLLVYPPFGVVVERREDRVIFMGLPLRHRDQTLVLRRMPKDGGEQPVEEVLRWRERDQIRQLKEPDRRHIPDTSRFGDAESAELGRSQPE